MWEVADCFIRRDSSVSVVTSLLDGRQRNPVSIPWIFFFYFRDVHTCCEDHRASFSVGAGVISPGVKLTHHIRLVPTLRMRGVIFMHPPSPTCLHGMMLN